jgi:hypothetical protein
MDCFPRLPTRYPRRRLGAGRLSLRHGAFAAALLVAWGCSHVSPTGRGGHTEASRRRRPVVGAIRWDGWIGEAPSYDVGLQVERSLGPQPWHSRLPFYAQELSTSEVQVRANTQAVMDQEIAFAQAAGLDYWAFVMYPPDNPQTRGGIDLYLRSVRRADIRFAMIVQSYTFGETDIARLLRYFADDNYQKVAGGRPLVFLVGPSKVHDPTWPHVEASVERLRIGAAQAGLQRPYIVHLWGWDGAKDVVDWLGLDAMGAYSLNFDDRAAPYAMLARKAEAKWDEWRATGAKVFPLVTAGWDRRPRVQNPVSWEKPDPPGAIDAFYATPSPAELAAHLESALAWCRRHQATADPAGVLIYAWNEIDEGGWLLPSRWPETGTERLDAVGQLLRRPPR